MTTVLIHPSSRGGEARVNLPLSLDVPVDFSRPDLDGTLTPEQRKALQERHPDGWARFWGTHAGNICGYLPAGP